MNASRFLKGGFNDFERSCLWDLRPIRIDNCQPLGKACGRPGGDGPAIWRPAYIYRSRNRGKGEEECPAPTLQLPYELAVGELRPRTVLRGSQRLPHRVQSGGLMDRRAR